MRPISTSNSSRDYQSGEPSPHMSQVSDLVNEAKLPTKLGPDDTWIHTFLESTSAPGRRPRRREREEIWKKIRHLGIGIFGTIWLEECDSDGGNKLRAVKEVRKYAPGLKEVDYTRELEAIVKFSQQRFDGCFVKSFGWFENDESLFVAMEYFPLGDLQKYMIRPFTEEDAGQVSLQLLEALDFMHSNGFAHRDLKPQNIFVLSAGPDWWVKIGDFGLGKRVLEGLTGLQALNGAPGFTAPEVYTQMWESEQNKEPVPGSEFTPEVDIWSLGVITYYMLTAKLLFSGRNDILAYYRGEAGLPAGDTTRNKINIEASDFLEKTLAATPTDRPGARELLNHVWLAPLLDQPDPEEQDQSVSAAEHTSTASPQMQSEYEQQAGIIPGTIDPVQTARPSDSPRQCLPFPRSGGDTYKQTVKSSMSLMNQDHPALSPRSGGASIGSSQYTESESSIQSSEPFHVRHISQFSGSDMSPTDTLPPYTRRGSETAPIPISYLTENTSTAGSPASSVTGNSERLSGKFRRVSQDIVPKRSRRSQEKKEKASSNSKAKSHIVEIPGRPQFAEGLPMFPMRSKKA